MSPDEVLAKWDVPDKDPVDGEPLPPLDHDLAAALREAIRQRDEARAALDELTDRSPPARRGYQMYKAMRIERDRYREALQTIADSTGPGAMSTEQEVRLGLSAVLGFAANALHESEPK